MTTQEFSVELPNGSSADVLLELWWQDGGISSCFSTFNPETGKPLEGEERKAARKVVESYVQNIDPWEVE